MELGAFDGTLLPHGMSGDYVALSDATSTRQLASSPPAASKSASPSTSASRCNSHIARILTLTEVRKAVWARIYRQGIQTGHARLSVTNVPSWKDFDTLMVKRHRFIAADPKDNRTLGWVSCFHPFPLLSLTGPEAGDAEVALDGTRGGDVIELQVYVAEDERGKGVGSILVRTVMESIETDIRYSTVQASFFPENSAARALFASAGFEHACTRSNIGRMQDGEGRGQWRDLVTVAKKLPDWGQADAVHDVDLLDSLVSMPIPELDTMLPDTTVDPHKLLKRQKIG